MRAYCFLTALLAVSLPVAAVAQQQPAAGGPPPRPMTLSTTAFADGAQIPAKYTQAGEQVSPALTWTNTPPGEGESTSVSVVVIS